MTNEERELRTLVREVADLAKDFRAAAGAALPGADDREIAMASEKIAKAMEQMTAIRNSIEVKEGLSDESRAEMLAMIALEEPS